MTDDRLRKSILQTIAYFHLFKIPLTDREIHKNLFSPELPATLADVQRTLSGELDRTLDVSEGFYFFRGADAFVNLRKERYLISDDKIKRSLFFIRIISKIPFVRAIFICNTLSCQNANRGSDIDLAIICEDNRIWLTRFLAVAMMKLLRKRPDDVTTNDKICLSFFVCESNLKLESLAYPGDIHFIYWLNQFMPVYDPEKFAEKFFEENSWTKKFLPNHFPTDTCARWRIDKESLPKNKIKVSLAGASGDFLEKQLKRLQLKIMPERLKKLAAEDNTDVVLNDRVLKFHDKDKRREYRGRWEKMRRRWS